VALNDKPDTLRAGSVRERLKVALFSDHLRIFPDNERTLDIGCGWGFSLKVNPNFYCVDADIACITHLKSIGAKAFMADVSGRLPFDEDFFDNAFTHDVLEHLEEQEMLSLFHDAHRIIKPGGIFMNIVPNRKGYEAGLDPAVGHKRFVTEKEVADAALKTGFEFIRSWHTPLPKSIGAAFTHNKLVTLLRVA